MRAPLPETGVRRVAVIAHSGASLVRFRGALVREIARRRHRVLALAPEGGWRERLAGVEGVETATFPLEPEGAGGAFADRPARRALGERLASFRPHVVLASGPRAAGLGVAAAREVATGHVVLLVNGLSALGIGEGVPNGWLAARGLKRRARTAVAAADLVLVHNAPDRQRLVAEGLMAPEHPCRVLPGSGVDLVHYAQAPLPPIAGGLVFLMLGRLARTTGADIYLEAAIALAAKAPNARFVLGGGRVRSADAVPGRRVEQAAGVVELAGHLDDVRPAIAGAHVLVHPSPSEGLPGAVLEAMSMGRPIIAADVSGSRQTVDERVNGILVPPGNAEALAAAMGTLLRRPDLLVSMARASRQKAERRFDEREVVQEMVTALGLG